MRSILEIGVLALELAREAMRARRAERRPDYREVVRDQRERLREKRAARERRAALARHPITAPGNLQPQQPEPERDGRETKPDDQR